MTGMVVLVTGANSGIGKELATYAAAKGAKLYMLCRSKDRAEKAKNDIMEATSNDKIDILLVSATKSGLTVLLFQSFAYSYLCVNKG